MPRKPLIPMLSSEIPQQRVYELKTMPPRPPGFQGFCAFLDPMPEADRPRGSPRKTEHVASAEWALGPHGSRFDCYNLQRRGRYWLMWNFRQDQDDFEAEWNWALYAWGLARRVDQKTAAIYLLRDAWAAERDRCHQTIYFLIDALGLLEVAEVQMIARDVWPDD